MTKLNSPVFLAAHRKEGMALQPAYGQSAPATEEIAIRRQLDALAAVRGTGDRKAEAQFYTDDGDQWGAGGFSRGRAALENRTPGARNNYRAEVVSLSFLTPEIALVDENYYSGSPQPAGHVFYLMVKRNGKWLIRAARVTPASTLSPAGSQR